MAPKIIDKKQKREEIALKAFKFIEEFGLENFSTTVFIKYLGIGKSSLYHYFESKEEILYEALYLVTIEYMKESEKRLNSELSLKGKLEILYEFYLIDSKENIWFRGIYLEYLKIFVDAHTDIMKSYNQDLMTIYQNQFKKVFEEEIEKGNIKPEALSFINTMITTADGMLIYSFSMDNFDLPKELMNYIDCFISLIEVKG